MEMDHMGAQSTQAMPQPKGMNFFNQLPPVVALLVGLVGGLLVLCTIGFFILLPMVLKGQTIGTGSTGTPTAVVPTQNPPTDNGQPVATGTVPPVTDKDHIIGSKNAPLTLLQYSDFECPFCKQFEVTLQQVLKDYSGKVRIVYRHYPLSFHANAQKEAEASECVAALGGNNAFWAFHDKIFERTTSNGYGFALADLGPTAVSVGVNQKAFQDCLDSGKYAQAVQDSENAASAAGVNGTPGTFLIAKDGSSQLISGAVPYAQLKAAIDAKL